MFTITTMDMVTMAMTTVVVMVMIIIMATGRRIGSQCKFYYCFFPVKLPFFGDIFMFRSSFQNTPWNEWLFNAQPVVPFSGLLKLCIFGCPPLVQLVAHPESLKTCVQLEIAPYKTCVPTNSPLVVLPSCPLLCTSGCTFALFSHAYVMLNKQIRPMKYDIDNF